MMKTPLTILFCMAISAFFLSCNNPVSLGARLDVEGPIVEFTSPVSRRAVPEKFVITGTVSDASGVEQLLLTTKSPNEAGTDVNFPRQWRYYRGSWQVSEDSSLTWQPLEGAEWNGSAKNASWKIPIDLAWPGTNLLVDGEYQFTVQAWDTAGTSDDNSYKTLTLVFDTNPPKVEIANPYLYDYRTRNDPESELYVLHNIKDDETDKRRDPARLGKFITDEFKLQWQIEDNHDVWSIDIRLYDIDTYIDSRTETPLPAGAVYQYHINLPPPPPQPDPANNLKPNGSITVPALDSLLVDNPINKKTTIQVVVSCYDAAGNPNQEKILGCIIYWPLAGEPWIGFPDGLNGSYGVDPLASAYVVYPGKKVKANAFANNGVKEVVYTIYQSAVNGSTDGGALNVFARKVIQNIPHMGGSYSSIFAWEFIPPTYSDYYIVRAMAYNDHTSIISGIAQDGAIQYVEGKTEDDLDADLLGSEFIGKFKVLDVSYPEFDGPPAPAASEPLYAAMTNYDEITINGKVSDLTKINSVYLVWINPQSRNYAAMSQLAYFRDKDYQGWQQAAAIPRGKSEQESGPWTYDSSNPNRLWNVQFTQKGTDPETGRFIYEYAQTIKLGDLDIGMDKQPLKSQVFLLRAEGTEGKCDIITYAPEGDSNPPEIRITLLTVERADNTGNEYIPGNYSVLRQFRGGDKITVSGTWKEDSTRYLNIENFLKSKLRVTINKQALDGTTNTTLTITPPSGKAANGTWEASGMVLLPEEAVGGSDAYMLLVDNLKDTLVVNAGITDIGGNPSEHGASWLIESEVLKFLRISSEEEDKTYGIGSEIDIFLEFNKPVKLKADRDDPVLRLNVFSLDDPLTPIGAAIYKEGQTNESTRQYFTYTVEAKEFTTERLNVIGLEGGDTGWNTSGYPFTWEYHDEWGAREEIRLTTEGDQTPADSSYTIQKLPVTTNEHDDDYLYTLSAGKSIYIDTVPPEFRAININIVDSATGLYTAGQEIRIELVYSKAVKAGTAEGLKLNITNTNGRTDTYTESEKTKSNFGAKTITFVYTILPGDTTNGATLSIIDDAGAICDLAGNDAPIPPDTDIRTITGVIIDAVPPAAPTITVYTGGASYDSDGASSTWNPSLYTSSAQFNGSSVSKTQLGNQYEDTLSLQVTKNEANADDTLEYSNNYGKTWLPYTAQIDYDLNGSYDITARQTDKAGNVSLWSKPITLTWDQGALVTRISSNVANGTYTNTSGTETGGDAIPITVTFRKPVSFAGTGNPEIVLNTTPPVTVSTTKPAGAVESLTFTYRVGLSDKTGATPLTVDSFSFTDVTVHDSTNTDVTSHINPPAAALLANLGDTKNIIIETGALTVSTAAAFTDTAVTGGGIQTNGSYHTAVTVTFSRPIQKTQTTESVKVIQTQTNYRLPAVLTEAQRNNFRDIVGFDTYYTKGINGYIGTGAMAGPDTSTKYVLNYGLDTTATANAPGAGTGVPQFAELFRQAESVSIPITASAVRINNTATTGQLIIELIDNNALQVPGATYEITIPAGFVQDSLGYQSPGLNPSLSIGGVAKPFIRVKKPDETFAAPVAGNANTPRYSYSNVNTDILQTTARIDCRTPGTAIRYIATTATTNVTAQNFGNALTGGDPAAPGAINNNGAGTAYTNGATIALGDTQYRGYQWRARARAWVGTNGSEDAEEMAYRTVLTYQTVNMNNNAPGQNMQNGDQVWIRGGDAISSSNIPGFPLTWEDDWATIGTKRAGIRLLIKANTTDALNNSTYYWVTWEVNVPVYFDIIMGRDNASDATTARQYGPVQFAPQRAGWTSYKEDIRLVPGKHRWLRIDQPNNTIDYGQGGKGAINFSGTMAARPSDMVYPPAP